MALKGELETRGEKACHRVVVSVFKVWSDYFTIDLKKAEPKKALPFYMCKPYYADAWFLPWTKQN